MSWDDRFISVIKEITWMTDKEGSFNKWLISKDLYEKIRDWDEIRKEDFDFFFSEKGQNLRHQDLILNETEKEFILLAREKRIDLKELSKKLPPPKKMTR
jgi:hypothetical protein